MTASAAPIAWIGMGIMGASMAGHLLEAGHPVTVHTRTKSRAEGLLARGAKWADSSREAAEHGEFVFAMVGMPSEVEEVFLGDQGVLGAKSPPRIAVNMATSSPMLDKKIAAVAKSRGVSYLDAPVSGGDLGARNGTLSIMVGGEAWALSEVMACFERMGKTIVHHGEVGSGQLCKVVNQLLVGANMVAAAEALTLSRETGLDSWKMLESVGGGAASSWTLTNLVPRMLRDDWDSGFSLAYLAKDLKIAVETCKELGLTLPGLVLSERLYSRLNELGHGAHGTQALLKLWKEAEASIPQ
ncbi:MAG: NAD(P)-dependent oxidoreductase [Planctomycetes bacterium]|nr:NAD(P)-dependent oxidoreductase [Planctomycetota bacterium]